MFEYYINLVESNFKIAFIEELTPNPDNSAQVTTRNIEKLKAMIEDQKVSSDEMAEILEDYNDFSVGTREAISEVASDMLNSDLLINSKSKDDYNSTIGFLNHVLGLNIPDFDKLLSYFGITEANLDGITISGGFIEVRYSISDDPHSPLYDIVTASWNDDILTMSGQNIDSSILDDNLEEVEDEAENLEDVEIDTLVKEIDGLTYINGVFRYEGRRKSNWGDDLRGDIIEWVDSILGYKIKFLYEEGDALLIEDENNPSLNNTDEYKELSKLLNGGGEIVDINGLRVLEEAFEKYKKKRGEVLGMGIGGGLRGITGNDTFDDELRRSEEAVASENREYHTWRLEELCKEGDYLLVEDQTIPELEESEEYRHLEEVLEGNDLLEIGKALEVYKKKREEVLKEILEKLTIDDLWVFSGESGELEVTGLTPDMYMSYVFESFKIGGEVSNSNSWNGSANPLDFLVSKTDQDVSANKIVELKNGKINYKIKDDVEPGTYPVSFKFELGGSERWVDFSVHVGEDVKLSPGGLGEVFRGAGGLDEGGQRRDEGGERRDEGGERRDEGGERRDEGGEGEAERGEGEAERGEGEAEGGEGEDERGERRDEGGERRDEGGEGEAERGEGEAERDEINRLAIVESGGDPSAKNGGSKGLLQITDIAVDDLVRLGLFPDGINADDFKSEGWQNREQNTKVGTAFFDYLKSRVGSLTGTFNGIKVKSAEEATMIAYRTGVTGYKRWIKGASPKKSLSLSKANNVISNRLKNFRS